MPVKFGVAKLRGRRVFELVKGYRSSIHELQIRKKSGDWPRESWWSDEFYDNAVTIEEANIDKNIARLKAKAEAVVEEALERIGLNIDITITENRFGRIKVLGECPACNVEVDLTNCIIHEATRLGLRCIKCGATRWVT